MAHIHEKIDFTASVLIVYNNKVLIRKHEKYGIWLTVGGHVELDEDPNQAAIREAKEEAGLDIILIPPPQYKSFADHDSRDLIPPYFVNRHSVSPTHEHIDNIFIATSTTDEVQPHEDETPTDFQWLSKEEVLDHTELGKRMTQMCLAALAYVENLRKN